MKEKKCICCSELKPKTEEFFYFRNKKRGWLSSWCKECRTKNRELSKEDELKKQKERRRKTAEERKCRTCGVEKLKPRCIYCEKCLIQSKKNKKKKDKCVYKSRLRKAMPSWADKDKIREKYMNRPKGFHVDHIIPIRGDIVCGLHVHYNLQYLLAETNIKKSNSFKENYRGMR